MSFLFFLFWVISESSQYALLLSYFQYSKHILDSDVPTTILQFLSEDAQEDEELDLEKVTIHILIFCFVYFYMY